MGRCSGRRPPLAGTPISPVQLANGLLLVATRGGPVALYDSQSGALLAQLSLQEGAATYDTVNTPGVGGNRAYLSTENRSDATDGRLYALDVQVPAGYDPTDPTSYDPEHLLQVAWFVPFGGPSGASPLVVGDHVFFDGDRLEAGGAFAPHVLALQDEGEHGVMRWRLPMEGRIKASYARDPRGGMWGWTAGVPRDDHPWLQRIALHDRDGDGQGDIIEQINLDELVGEAGIHVPTSAMSMAGPPAAPVLMVNATAFNPDGSVLSTYVVAVDLVHRELRWKVELPSAPNGGQFPLLESAQGPRLIFTNWTEGTWAIGEP